MVGFVGPDPVARARRAAELLLARCRHLGLVFDDYVHAFAWLIDESDGVRPEHAASYRLV